MAKDFNRYFLQDDIRGEKNAQSWSREKYTTRYHFTYTRMSMIKKKKTSIIKDVETMESAYILNEFMKCHSCFG